MRKVSIVVPTIPLVCIGGPADGLTVDVPEAMTKVELTISDVLNNSPISLQATYEVQELLCVKDGSNDRVVFLTQPGLTDAAAVKKLIAGYHPDEPVLSPVIPAVSSVN